MKILLLALTILVTGCGTNDYSVKNDSETSFKATSKTIKKANLTKSELQAKYAVVLFSETCLAFSNNPKMLFTAIHHMKFRKMLPKATKYFTGTKNASAWFVKSKHGEYIVAYLKNGMCNVYSRHNDSKYLQSYLKSWISTNISKKDRKTKTISSDKKGPLITNIYLITENDQPYQNVVVSTTTSKAKFQGLLTASNAIPNK